MGMIERNDHIVNLIGKYLENSLDTAEQQALDAWVNASDSHHRLFEELTSGTQVTAGLQQFYAYDGDHISRKISEQVPEFGNAPVIRAPRRFFMPGWGWAAAALLLLAGSTWYWMARRVPGQQVTAIAADIPPGRQGAILTLADGRQVVLDSLPDGMVASQQGTAVTLAKGQLVYNGRGNAGSILYNKMTTPRGRQFQVTLPDGTKAWLNAASSIRYPVAFAGNERRVDITGEVCFEVAADAGHPFIVNVNNKAAITVLGTLFNVNAYDNERTISATLLNGRIKVAAVAAPGESVLLQPGQQASVSNAQQGTIQITGNADLEKIMAWKNGLFNFEGAGLEEVMRQLERWYDIDVVYENGIPNITFLGEMNRQIPLADLLEILKSTGVDFRIEGRKLVVLNN